MKSNQLLENRPAPGIAPAFAHLCLRSCQKVLAQIWKVKSAIFAEWRDGIKDHENMLRLALIEAEALAWQTEYPHLVFPALAAEKVRAVADWSKHQQSVWQTDPLFALAA
jgi:hypothetical protein